MGAAASAARAKAEAAADDTERKVSQMMTVLANKLDAMKLEIEQTRGLIREGNKTEVAGGRTVMRISEIRVSTEAGVDEQIKGAIGNFFDAAQGSVGGEDEKAKVSAIKGAETLVIAGIDALFGVSNGQAMEKKSFVDLFLNNAFVRVDYFMYTYSISAKKWGAQANEAGCCYVADLSVLDMAKLTPNEIDFLVSQALSIESEDFDRLMDMKVRLIEVSILSKALEKKDLSFREIEQIVEELGEAQKTINTAFRGLTAVA